MKFSQLSPSKQDEYASLDVEDIEVSERIERKELCQNNFRAFSAEFWDVIDPAPYEATWITDAIADHLQAVVRSEIRRLLINVFFRSAKTTFGGVLLQPWAWIQDPKETMIYLSHTSRRALSASDHSRDLMKSKKFQSIFWFF